MHCPPYQGLILSVAMGAAALACSGESGPGGLGDGCLSDADCGEGLSCDLHDADVGTCQEPHEH